MENNKKEKISTVNKVIIMFSVLVGFVLLIFIVANVSLYIQTVKNPQSPPSLAGITPMVVASNSMNSSEQGIQKGDLIFAKKHSDISEINSGDIILFMQDKSTVLHRVESIKNHEGQTLFVTKGDSNNTVDELVVHEDNIIGKYTGKIPKLGNVVLFMKTPLGITFALAIPLVLILIFFIISKQKTNKANQKQIKKMQQELLILHKERESTYE